MNLLCALQPNEDIYHALTAPTVPSAVNYSAVLDDVGGAAAEEERALQEIAGVIDAVVRSITSIMVSSRCSLFLSQNVLNARKEMQSEETTLLKPSGREKVNTEDNASKSPVSTDVCRGLQQRRRPLKVQE